MGALTETRRRVGPAPASEFALLGSALALAAGGIAIVSAAVARQRRSATDADEPESSSGKPELPDEPLGVPAQDAEGNGGVELPGFPRIDPTHG